MMNGAPQQKVLPPRPGQDLGYGGGYGGQNVYGNENANPQGYGSTQSRGGPPEPNGRVALEGYRKNIINGFDEQKPRYNPVSTRIRLQSWPQLTISP
jgi:hypothetical protein